MKSLSEKVIAKINEFSEKHRLDCKINKFTGNEMFGDDSGADIWSIFEDKAGVYCFIKVKNDKIIYIGESSSNIANRINKWIKEPTSEKENKVSNEFDEEDLVIIVTIEEQKYLAQALETYLLQELGKTLYNDKYLT